MNFGEKFPQPSKIEITKNKPVNEEFKNLNKTAEILSVTSTPRSEINKNNELFMESVFPKTNKLGEEVKEVKELEILDEINKENDDSFNEPQNGLIESFKEETPGIKSFFKKLFLKN